MRLYQRRGMNKGVICVLLQLLLQLIMHPGAHAAAHDLHAGSSLGHQRQLTGVVRGGGGFGGFRPTSSRPAPVAARPGGVVTGYPVQPAARPGGVVTGYPVQPAAASRTAGATALPGGFRSYGRPGFRSTPFILPFAAGFLTAGAASSLARSQTAYCNGLNIQCYKAACQDALRTKCPDAAAGNASLVLTACPDSRYSECYKTETFNNTALASFECFGTRRPRYNQEDLSAVCHQPGASSSAGKALSKALLVPLALASAALLAWL